MFAFALSTAGQYRGRDSTRQRRENWLSLPDVLTEEADPLAEGVVNVGLHGVFVEEVDDFDGLVLLPHAVDSPDALLHTHRVPGHVVIDERAAELEIQTFSRGLSAHQHVGVAPAEDALDFVAGDCSPGAIAVRDLAASAREAHHPRAVLPGEQVPQEVHGVGVLGEDHDLGVAVLAKLAHLVEQDGGLGVRGKLFH